MPEPWRRHTAEDRARAVETIRRRASAESRSVSRRQFGFKVNDAILELCLGCHLTIRSCRAHYVTPPERLRRLHNA